MASPIIIRLSGLPVGKGRPRFAKATGHAFTPGRTRSYESALRLAGQDVMGEAAPIDGPLAVSVVAVFPVPVSWPKKRRAAALSGDLWPTIMPDADNLLKVLDALNEVVWRDDKQIAKAAIEKRYGAKPELVIQIEELAPVASSTVHFPGLAAPGIAV
ncbi:RusA family crossover junction endodeoxyribonuclease [Methylobacterium sp. Leaf108]|uniref:RusA family crossover junction endodeoxyribonuclease n=1 Tax=Methylobacterium sp. Leaf108 TaxID=1736256 RepID=UPI0009E7211D|nr:RusA family crossover junction endodeoxyribonuclease [Methylobacterium sp. Leaf108]